MLVPNYPFYSSISDVSKLFDIIEDFVDFLKKCEKALVPGGCICIKDNVAARNCIFDADDSSVTR